MSHAGQQQTVPIDVTYAGTDTIYNGYAVCYDHDNSDAGLRESRVEKPTLASLLADGFAGVVVNLPSAGLAGDGSVRTLKVIPATYFKTRNVNVYTDENVAAGDVLGPIPGSYNFGRAVIPGCAFFRAGEAQDRSGTAGKVNGVFGFIDIRDVPTKISRFTDHFRASLVDKVVANIATGPAGHYLLNGTTAVTYQAVTATPASTGTGELVLVGTTTTIAQIQQAGGQYLLSAGRSLFCRMRVKIDDISDEDWFWGLGTAPTHSAGVLTAVAQVTSGGTAPAGTNYAGFFFDATGGSNGDKIIFTSRKASGTAVLETTGIAPVNDTYIDLAFLIRNRVAGSTAAGAKTMQAFINGVQVNSFTSAIQAAQCPDTVPLAWAMSGITGGCMGTIDLLDIVASH